MQPTGVNTPVGTTIVLPGSEEDILDNLNWLVRRTEEYNIDEFVYEADPDFEYSDQQRKVQKFLEEYDDYDYDAPREGKWAWVEFLLRQTIYSYAYTKGAKMHLSSPEIQSYEESAFSSRGAGGGPVVI